MHIQFFRHPKLSENAGYGIDKILRWKDLTGNAVVFNSDALISTLTYPLKTDSSRQNEVIGTNNVTDVTDSEKKVIEAIRENPKISQVQIAEQMGYSSRQVKRIMNSLKEKGKIVRIGTTKGGHWEVVK